MPTPVSNPANPQQPEQPVAPAIPEELVAQWNEPEHEIIPLEPTTRLLVMVAGPLIIVGFIVLGVWLDRFSYYLAAIAAASAIAAIVAQSRQKQPSLTISLTTTRLIVGKKSYSVSDLSGFWMQKESEQLIIHVEMNKATIVPITFSYSSRDVDEARAQLSQVLPEVEARMHQIGDSVNRYFRL